MSEWKLDKQARGALRNPIAKALATLEPLRVPTNQHLMSDSEGSLGRGKRAAGYFCRHGATLLVPPPAATLHTCAGTGIAQPRDNHYETVDPRVFFYSSST